jgi:hypothetical protein
LINRLQAWRVSGFEQPRTENPMNLNRAADDLAGDEIELRVD